MSSNFTSLRSARQNALDKLNQEIKKESQKAGGGNDERFWKLTVDPKTKIGYAVIRFLPSPKNEDVPWVRIWSHSFQRNGVWYFENCPTTLTRECPCCKENNRLWNSGVEADKDVARERKRKLNFISNILVVTDPAHPENNGKVFIYKYGKKIHTKVAELINPQFPDQAPTDPFDMWAGANFKLKAAQVAGYQNYDRSEFDAPAAIPGNDEALEKLWESEYSLQAFVAPSEFKAYDVLEKRLQKVLTGSGGPATAEDAIKQDNASVDTAQAVAQSLDDDEEKPKARAGRKSATKPVAPVVPPDDDAPESEEDIRSFFSKVLED